MKEKYNSRKFLLSLLVILIGTIGLFTGFIAAAEFVSLCVLSLTVYAGSNIWNKKVTNDTTS